MRDIYIPDGFVIDVFWLFVFVICAVALTYIVLKIGFARSNSKSDDQLVTATRAYLALTMQESRLNENHKGYYFIQDRSKEEYLENKRKIQADLNQAEVEYKKATRILRS